MARGAFVIELKSDAVAEYVRRHQDVPAALAQVTRDSGIRNYSIFVRGTTAFGYFEADDVTAAVASGRDAPVVIAWQAEMMPLLKDETAPLSLLEEVFHLD